MTRERLPRISKTRSCGEFHLLQGILQSVATVAFLPQVRPVIETLFPNRHQAVYHQNEPDSYDETKNPAIRPIEGSTFKVRRPFRVTVRKE